MLIGYYYWRGKVLPLYRQQDGRLTVKLSPKDRDQWVYDRANRLLKPLES